MSVLDLLHSGAQPHEVAWVSLSALNFFGFELHRAWRWGRLVWIYWRQPRLSPGQTEEENIIRQRFLGYLVLSVVTGGFTLVGLLVLFIPPPITQSNQTASLWSATVFFLVNLAILGFNLTNEALIARHRRMLALRRRQAPRDLVRDAARDTGRDTGRDLIRDTARDKARDLEHDKGSDG
jgi:hypothetical protein